MKSWTIYWAITAAFLAVEIAAILVILKWALE